MTDDAGPTVAVAPLVGLWRHAVAFRRRIVFASVFSVLNKLFDLAPPFLIGAAVDVVVQGNESFLGRLLGIADPRDQLVALAVVTVVIWVGESVFEYLFQVAWRNLAQDIQHELRLDAYSHIQDLELAYFEDQSTGGLMSILNDDVNQLERFLDRGANDILQLVTTLVVVGGAFFVLLGNLAWLAFLPIPVIAGGSLRFQRTLEPHYARVRDRVGALNATLSNNLSGITTIKAFTAERRERDRIDRESTDYADANRGAIRLSSGFVPLIRMAILVGFTCILLFGGFRALDGALDVGIYSVMVFITQRLLWPLTRLGETFDLYQRGMASTRRILDLLQVAPSINPGDTSLGTVDGAIAFRGVGFRYASGPPVLTGLDLDVPAGETHAVVGSTGSGKSTLVKLLLRLYDPTDGEITLDGVPLPQLDFDSLRGSIGLVSQDVFLFHGTVAENVRYGREDATDVDLGRAVALAEADAFIDDLDDGMDTVVGERGQKLSGGQRQRLSIARAIVKDPAVLVLDEATSAVDNETEAAIQRSLAKVSRDRTTIVIAHRLSTVRHADRIHVLHDGRVAEAGTHEELLDLGGRYAALWRVQTGEAEPVPA